MDPLELVDYYLGNMMERIIIESDYPIDLEEEYEDLLNYLYRRLSIAWFNTATPDPVMFEEKLKEVKRKYRKRLSILLSYLISRYVSRKSTLRIKRGRSRGSD